jgi:hypothetical protein
LGPATPGKKPGISGLNELASLLCLGVKLGFKLKIDTLRWVLSICMATQFVFSCTSKKNKKTNRNKAAEVEVPIEGENDPGFLEEVVVEPGVPMEITIDGAKVSLSEKALAEQTTMRLERLKDHDLFGDTDILAADPVLVEATTLDGKKLSREDVKDDFTLTLKMPADLKDEEARILVIEGAGTEEENRKLVPKSDTEITTDEQGEKLITIHFRETGVVFAIVKVPKEDPNPYSDYVSPPLNPKDFSSTASTATSISLTWKSPGGSASRFLLSYLEGGTAPASCQVGSRVTEAVIGNNTSYTIANLTAGTTYTVRICSQNDLAPPDTSSGSVATFTTLSLPAPSPPPIGEETLLFSAIADKVLTPDAAISGAPIPTIDVNLGSGGDTGITYSCTYDQTVDGLVNSGTNCGSLPGTATVSTSAGTLDWTPSVATTGVFEVKFIGTNGNDTGSEIFVIRVRPNYVADDLLFELDASLGNFFGLPGSGDGTWKDLSNNGMNGSILGTPIWNGNGSDTDVYRLTFDGSSDYVDMGDQSTLELAFPLTIQAWIAIDTLPSASSEHSIMQKWETAGDQREWKFSIDSNDKISFSKSRDGTGGGQIDTIVSDEAFTADELNKWFHVAIAINSSGAWEILKNGRSVGSGSLTNLSIFAGSATAKLGRAFDGSISQISVQNRALTGNEVNQTFSALKTDKLDLNGIHCPSGYVGIPANATAYAPADFCVMRYNAKIAGNDNGNQAYSAAFAPDSRASGTPWVNLTRDQAKDECDALGTGFKLISNAQYQALGRNIETAQDSPGVYKNWSNNSISDSNFINMGHSDNSPANTLAAGTDSDPCFETGNPSCADNSHADFAEKRTHTLSTDEIIWDTSGNVHIWVRDNNSTSQGANDWATQNPENTKEKWGPTLDYSAKTSGLRGGLGYQSLSYTGSVVMRGGYWDPLFRKSGLFSTNLSFNTSTKQDNIGFRCSYQNRAAYIDTSGIDTDDLILHFDATKANMMAGAFADDSCASEFEWMDLTANANDGTLTNFSSCGDPSGWNGDGSTSDPYRLVFDGIDDYIITEANDAVDSLQAGTFVTWFKAQATGGSQNLLNLSSTGTDSSIFAFIIDSDNKLQMAWKYAGGAGQWSYLTASSVVTDGNWHYAAFVADGSSTVKIYVDNLLQTTVLTKSGGAGGSNSDWFAATNEIGSYTHHLSIGARIRQNGVASYLNGEIAFSALYSRALSATELTNNCNAQKSRFQGAVCN